ncbi:hypothetical protein BJ875DRAFT_506427 [Amylocarpus encephaloides]|uniref:Zn(2)-C6 fungal-type domain-containing protein n=1 Tax=Amylocarpus encephaloides TaxID=45428 RepID=A0A9P7YEY1_9HELO|nr:hypothetical protein BJ875DRAFT_506427 [Amylocarpus encephaloides]
MSENQGKGLRPHSQPRGGCRRCEHRRVKCNESRPACSSCIRCNEPCEYFDEPSRNIRHNHKGSPSTRNNSTSPLQSSHSRSFGDFTLTVSHESTERHLLEMRLLHHFVTSTVQNKFLSPHDQSTTDMWLHLTPSLAFDHPFLMYAMLSVSALHIAKTQPGAVEMRNTHRVYFDAALNQHRNAVQNLSVENAEAICLSAVLISVPSLALLEDVEASPYSPPIYFFDLFASSVPVFASVFSFLPEKSGVRVIIDASPGLDELPQLVNNEIYEHRFSKLRSWRGSDEDFDTNNQNAYDYVLQFVGFLANQGFLQRDPRALVLLAHYFSLATSMEEDVWWLKGIAEKQVLGIQSILPMDWQWAMAFPLQRVLRDAMP